MPDIFELVNSKEIATYYNENPSNNVPYLGAILFPNKKQLGLDLSWIKGANGLPIALKPAAFDTKASIRDRIGFDKIQTEMPFFKESMRIGERERQELNKAVGAVNSEIYLPVIQKIYDDANNLVKGAEVQAERMRMQLLGTGKISISADGVAYDYPYGMKEDHKETLLTTAKWSDAVNSNPIADIKRWQDKIEDDTGERPSNAICTRGIWNYLMENKKIRLSLNPVGGENVIVDDDMLKAYLYKKLKINIAVYSKKFALHDGTSQTFFPENVFSLIPDGTLGNTYMGTTPEESDLMAGSQAQAQVEIVNTGVAITTTKETDPVNVKTKVSMIALPSFEGIDKVFIGNVA